jgi:hypothetical protein
MAHQTLFSITMIRTHVSGLEAALPIHEQHQIEETGKQPKTSDAIFRGKTTACVQVLDDSRTSHLTLRVEVKA